MMKWMILIIAIIADVIDMAGKDAKGHEVRGEIVTRKDTDVNTAMNGWHESVASRCLHPDDYHDKATCEHCKTYA